MSNSNAEKNKAIVLEAFDKRVARNSGRLSPD
jgi:hypothetical protein